MVAGIKKDKYQNINPIKPDNLAAILIKVDCGKLTEIEIKEGSIKYIINNLLEVSVSKGILNSLDIRFKIHNSVAFLVFFTNVQNDNFYYHQ